MSLAGKSAIYMGFSVLTRAIPFTLIPFLTKHLSAADYGTLSIYTSIFVFVTCISSLGQETVISRNYFYLDSIKFKSQLSTSLILQITASALIAVIFFIFFLVRESFFEIPRQFIFLLISSALLQNVYRLFMVLTQVKQRAFIYGVLQCLQVFIELSLSILLISQLSFQWEGRVYSQAISFLIILLVIFLGSDFKKHITSKPEIKQHFGTSLHIGAPILLHSIFSLVFTIADKFILQAKLGLGAVGLYAVAFQIGSAISIIATAFNQAWTPWLFSKLADKNNSKSGFEIVKNTYIYSFFIIVGTATYSLLVLYIGPHFVDLKYHESLKLVPWVAAGGAFTGLYYMFGNYLVFANKTSTLAKITGGCAVFGIISNIVLIETLGVTGAAVSALLTQALFFLITMSFAVSTYRLPWF